MSFPFLGLGESANLECRIPAKSHAMSDIRLETPRQDSGGDKIKHQPPIQLYRPCCDAHSSGCQCVAKYQLVTDPNWLRQAELHLMGSNKTLSGAAKEFMPGAERHLQSPIAEPTPTSAPTSAPARMEVGPGSVPFPSSSKVPGPKTGTKPVRRSTTANPSSHLGDSWATAVNRLVQRLENLEKCSNAIVHGQERQGVMIEQMVPMLKQAELWNHVNMLSSLVHGIQTYLAERAAAAYHVNGGWQ